MSLVDAYNTFIEMAKQRGQLSTMRDAFESGFKAAQEAAAADKSELLAALQTMKAWASTAAALNDADHIPGNAVKAHKILLALAGCIPRYDAKIDAAHAAIAKHGGGE